MSSNDAWLLYADTRDRLIALVRPLDEAEADTVVPITPGWSIAAVVAHVCGLNADIAAGMRERLGTDERTTHQVASRAGRTIADLCDEWLLHGPAMQAAIDESEFLGRRLTADLVVHLHDLQHALGEQLDITDEATMQQIWADCGLAAGDFVHTADEDLLQEVLEILDLLLDVRRPGQQDEVGQPVVLGEIEIEALA